MLLTTIALETVLCCCLEMKYMLLPLGGGSTHAVACDLEDQHAWVAVALTSTVIILQAKLFKPNTSDINLENTQRVMKCPSQTGRGCGILPEDFGSPPSVIIICTRSSFSINAKRSNSKAFTGESDRFGERSISQLDQLQSS